MEEVDRIILHSLRQIGCELDDEVTSLQQFTTEMIVEAAVRCLQNIVLGIELSPRLPPGMTARFRVGSALAQACLDLDYPGEVGYQTFLYWDEVDIRRVLMFLIEKLPREIEKAADEPLSASARLDSRIASELKQRLRIPWLPRHFQFKDVRWTEIAFNKRSRPRHLWAGNDMDGWYWKVHVNGGEQGFSKMKPFRSRPITYPRNVVNATKEKKAYYCNYLDIVTNQVVSPQELCCSVMEANSVSIAASHSWESEWNQKGLTSRLSEQEFRTRKKQQVQHRMQLCLQQEIQKGALSSYRKDDARGVSQLFSHLENDRATASAAVAADSHFALSEKLVFKKDMAQQGSSLSVAGPTESEEELQKKRHDEEASLQSDLDGLAERLRELQLEGKILEGGIQQMHEQISSRKANNEEMLDVYKIKKKTFDLLPDADANLEKLQGVVDSTVQRLVNLASQWEKHRAPLVDQYRTLRELNASRVSETQRKLEEIRGLREKMKELAEEARAKGELHRQLMTDYEKLTRDFNRSAYTRRILEIVANIKKQKQDIDKVLVDTKEVQKEINQLSGKLDRTFTVTDEVVFKDAKRDVSICKAYKYLAALHDNCSILVKTVEETGAIMREIRDLEDLIENENQKKVLANLERIMADYKQMKQENAVLIAKVKDQQYDDQ